MYVDDFIASSPAGEQAHYVTTVKQMLSTVVEPLQVDD